RIRRQTLQFADLPAGLDGFRIVQLSDVHCGVFAPRERVRSWVRLANRQGADLAVVTGDLIASGPDHVTTVAAALAELRGTSGTFVCMGNHDYFGGAGEAMIAALADHRVRLLRNESVRLERGGDAFTVAGIDDAHSHRDDLDAALAGREGFVILLAHDPDGFAGAAERGVPLTLSGHTHGGQLAVPLASRRLNLAHLVSPLTDGVYRRGASILFVSCGIGTSGPPIRIGTRGEIAVLTLKRGPG
ncbi:MAG TPA: metallophosphoesterase, partial [Kofleriaceae bacterium]|nr:metallophosphoesterase [Kofleriaceae bacterium]